MVDSVKEIIDKYQNKTIKTVERLTLLLAELHSFNKELIIQDLKNFNVDQKQVENILDSFLIILHGNKVKKSVKELIKNDEFLDHNPQMIHNLARVYFYCDVITLEGNEIITKKEFKKVAQQTHEPNIDINKAISQILLKIKYNKVDNKVIAKIEELSKYESYRRLYNLLIQAIEHEAKIKQLEDNQLNITINELEELLS